MIAQKNEQGDPHMRNGFTILCTLALATLALSANAEENRLQPDFTFKRVVVPNGAGNRINVQIAPRAPGTPSAPSAAGANSAGASSAASAAVSGAVPQASEVAWFWQAISPKLEDNVPGRLIMALDAMNKAPKGQEVSPPSLDALTRIASRHGIDILRATIGTKVSPALVLSVIAVESAGKSDARSKAGAMGLMQLMPATAARFDVSNALDPVENIKGGVAYLDWLMGEFDGDPILVLASYNSGEGTVRDGGGVPDYAETRRYVPKVLAAWTVAQALCMTPPELISDGCVFSVKN